MLNKKVLVTSLWFAIASFLKPVLCQSNNSSSFTLTSHLSTSAGVFKSDGTLVRTLWSGKKYDAGTYPVYWDRKDDNGNLVQDTTGLKVQVLSNNVKYEWEGARIGNTSTAFTGNTRHRAGEPFSCFAIVGDNIYYGANYEEGFTSQFRTNVSNTQQRISIGPSGSTNQVTQHVCTDGINVYWAGTDGVQPSETFIMATKVSDNSFFTFTYGETAQMDIGILYNSVVSHMIDVNSNITDIAVQKTGNKLFVSRKGLNQLQVLDKTTGQLLQTLAISGVGRLAIDRTDKLILSHGATIEKYTVNADGTIISTAVTFTGVTSPGAMAVSPDNNTVIVADDDVTKQVVKSFSNNTGGAATSTLGIPGGYMNDAAVNNNKFYFADSRRKYFTSLAYQDDGSFWVLDMGNYRMQHYNSSGVFIDRIMYMPSTYRLAVDPNTPTRVFANYLEFLIDYSKPLDANNGSWQLVKNWGANISTIYDQGDMIRAQITLSNGRTYGRLRGTGVNSNTNYVVELVEGGTTRLTSVTLSGFTNILPDGTKIIKPNEPLAGGQVIYYKYPLTGFDSNNDPVWSSTSETIATTPVLTNNDPIPAEDFNGKITSTDKIITFNPEKYTAGNGQDFHLGAIKKGDNKWLWKVSRGTAPGYIGDFPPDGSFDNFNTVQYAGGLSLVTGQNILWNYHGEFWKQSQTNKWNHYYDNGLFVGQFGALTSDYTGQESFPEGAGNVLAASVVNVGGITYLYHCDESVNAAVHRWKITGLNTINVQTCNYTLGSSPIDGADLMAGLTRNITITNNNGWVSSAPYESNNNGNNWKVTTGLKSYDPFAPVDILAMYTQPSGSRFVTRDLGTNLGLSSWSVKGQISFPSNSPVDPSTQGGSYFEVLDNNDKVIARLWESTPDYTNYRVNANNTILIQNINSERAKYITKDEPFEVSCNGGAFTFKYMSYTQTTTSLIDNTANWQNPTKIRLYFFTNGDNYDRGIDVKGLRFKYTNSLVTSTPIAPTLTADDVADTLVASHALGTSEILVSENGGAFVSYTGKINVGNVARAAGYWKFKIKASTNRNESAVVNSPEFTAVTTPDAPTLKGDDVANTLTPSSVLGSSEIVVSENGGAFVPYTGTINVGNVARAAGYWKFKIKASTLRNESAVVNSPEFTAITTPDAPILAADDVANTLSATSVLGTSEIVVSENGGAFVAYAGQISVGNVARAAGYWKFKIKASTNRNESAVVNSLEFTTVTTPDAPTLIGDDVANTLTASSVLGTSAIVVSENGGAFVAYAGQINVGYVARAVGYWKFKIKASTLRNESAVVNSPAFTAITTPDAPTLAANDIANTLSASSVLGTSEILVSKNGGAFVAYTGQINVGNAARAAGYWKFKIKIISRQ